jgi:hypothetical protein
MSAYQLTGKGSVLRVADGAYIPIAPGNADYAAYQQWLAAGNTADPVPVPPKPTTISADAFFTRFTAPEQSAVWSACVTNAPLGVALTNGLAAGSIDLTSSTVSTWMQGLVTAGAITQARMTAILTP